MIKNILHLEIVTYLILKKALLIKKMLLYLISYQQSTIEFYQ